MILYSPPLLLPIYKWGFALYMAIMGLCGVLDHSGIRVVVPGFYDTADHDLHHRWSITHTNPRYLHTMAPNHPGVKATAGATGQYQPLKHLTSSAQGVCILVLTDCHITAATSQQIRGQLRLSPSSDGCAARHIFGIVHGCHLPIPSAQAAPSMTLDFPVHGTSGQSCGDLNKGACTTPRPQAIPLCVCVSFSLGRWHLETKVSMVCLYRYVSLPLHHVQTSTSEMSPGGRPTCTYYWYWLALQTDSHKRQVILLPSPPPFDTGSIRPPSPSFSLLLPPSPSFSLLGILLLDEMLVMPYRRTVQLLSESRYW